MHWKNAAVLGLIPGNIERDKENRLHGVIREGAKTFRYAFLYGAGAGRAGQIIYNIARAAQQINSANDLGALLQRFFGGTAHPNDVALRRVGKSALDKFEAATPGLRQLKKSLRVYARHHGWLPGLHGCRVPVRALYTVLNYVVTSSEAIICKRWLMRTYDELCARFRYGWDGDVVIVLWIYDELVCCCRPEIAEQVGEILVRHAKEAGEHYGFKVPLDAEFKIGRSWAGETDGPPRAISATSNDAAVGHEGDESGRNSSTILTAPPLAPDDAPAISRASNKWIPLPELIGKSLTDGKICCPFHDDSTPSLHVYNDHFHCFGCGAHGDAVDWLMMIESLDRNTALQVLEGHASHQTSRPVENPTNDALKRRRALRLWRHAVPVVGTLAERYLTERRRIDLSALPDYGANSLRFHPNCPFGPGKWLPCLIALRRDVATDEPLSIHRIGLTQDGEKIDRRLLGHGGVVKLWPVGAQLTIGEGIETTLAAATRISYRGAPLQPAWAAVSSGALSVLPIIPGVEELIILVDHDVNGAGQAAAFRLSERWSRAGHRVVRLTPKRPNSDFNDLIMEFAS